MEENAQSNQSNVDPRYKYILENIEQEKKYKGLEKFVKFDIWLNIFLGLIVIMVSGLLVLQSLNFFDSGSKNDNNNSVSQVADNNESSFVEVASAKQELPVYINQQGIDIDKVFQIPGDNTKVTVSGKLKKEVFGFLPYWAATKLDEIDTKMLTEISYFGLEVDGNGKIIKFDASGKAFVPWTLFQSDKIFNDYLEKAKKDKIKVYVTLKCFNQLNIIKLTTSPEARENFIQEALYLMNTKSLDGINIDFEYIGTPDPKVRDGFSILMKDLNQELKRQYPNSILTIDTFVDAASNTRIHDIPVLAENSDGLVIMAYDFHTPNSAITGPVAPIEGYGLNLFGLLSSYLEKAPSEKITIAIAYYGYDWVVGKAEKNAKVIGGATNVKILSYAEIANSSRNTQIYWDENAKTPWYSYTDFVTKLPRVVHFENPRSLGIKYDIVNDKSLRGIGIWALGFDGNRTDLQQLINDKFSN